MNIFRLLFFRDNVLERAEVVSAHDVLEAVGHAAGQPPDIRVEIWSDHRRVGVIAAQEAYNARSKRRWFSRRPKGSTLLVLNSS